MADDERQRDTEAELSRGKLRLAHQITRSITIIVGGVIGVFALKEVARIFRYIRGEDTDFDFGVDINIAIGITVVVSGLIGWKLLSQRRELRRLRARVQSLEGDVARLSGVSEPGGMS